MLIKVCGMREAENIRQVEALAIDWMGFILYPPSKRYCLKRPEYLPDKCKCVGVFVNATTKDIVEHTKNFAFDLIQLHGKEDRKFVIKLRKAIAKAEIEKIPLIIKAFSLRGAEDLKKTEELVGFVDYFLFDTPSAGYGGSGQKFDWTLLSNYHHFTPFLLSGGIGPDDVQQIKSLHHPQLIGLDLNSKFETMPGVKDIEKLNQFITAINKPSKLRQPNE